MLEEHEFEYWSKFDWTQPFAIYLDGNPILELMPINFRLAKFSNDVDYQVTFYGEDAISYTIRGQHEAWRLFIEMFVNYVDRTSIDNDSLWEEMMMEL